MNSILHLIANERSGMGHGGTLHQLAEKICLEHNAKLVTYDISDPKDLSLKSQEAVRAAQQDGGVVVAAGGDGTIRSVAQEVYGKNVCFGVIPCGTFNYFARAHNIPEDHEGALKLALTGTPKLVRLGDINGKVFLINASMGLYAKAIREREQMTSRFGRRRIVALISTFKSFLRPHRNLNVELMTQSEIQKVKTPMIFIGNNALQLRSLKLDVAKCMKSDRLAAVTMRPVTRYEVCRIFLRGLAKTLEKEEALDTFCVDSLLINTNQRSIEVALDGELFRMDGLLNIRALPEALRLMKSN